MNIYNDGTHVVIENIFYDGRIDGRLYAPINTLALDVLDDAVMIKSSKNGDVLCVTQIDDLTFDGTPADINTLYEDFDAIATGSGSGPGPAPTGDYFKITCLETGDFNVSFTLERSAAPFSFDYSIDGENWTTANISQNTTIPVVGSSFILFRNGSLVSYNYNNEEVNINVDKQYKVSGKLSYLNTNSLRKQLAGLFRGSSTLINAEGLETPAVMTDEHQLASLFYGCSNLVKGPRILPATTLSSYCYANMFYACTSFTKAPILPATTIGDSAYSRMFYDCTSLTEAPELNGTVLNGDSYRYMFYHCTSLTKAPVLNNATINSGQPYAGMFDWCSNLSYIKCLSTNLWYYYYYDWVRTVAPLGKFVCADGYKNNWNRGDNGVPNDWELIEESEDTGISITPRSVAYGTISSLGTLSQTFTITSDNPLGNWTYSASSTDSHYSYVKTENTLTVTYNVNETIINQSNIDNTITFTFTDATMTASITGYLDIPSVQCNWTPWPLLLNDSDSDNIYITSDWFETEPAECPYTVSIIGTAPVGWANPLEFDPDNHMYYFHNTQLQLGGQLYAFKLKIEKEGYFPFIGQVAVNYYKGLRITNTGTQEGVVSLTKTNNPQNISLSVSTDEGLSWTSYNNISSTTTFSLPAKTALLIDGSTNTGFSDYTGNYWHFSADVSHTVSGELHSLVANNVATAGMFYGLFMNDTTCSDVQGITFGLTLSNRIYSNMFAGCTGMPYAPYLQGNILAEACYEYMFYNSGVQVWNGCGATTLVDYCFSNMFAETPLYQISGAPISTDLSGGTALTNWLPNSNGTIVTENNCDTYHFWQNNNEFNWNIVTSCEYWEGGTWDDANCQCTFDTCGGDPQCDCETNQGGTWDHDNNICIPYVDPCTSDPICDCETNQGGTWNPDTGVCE